MSEKALKLIEVLKDKRKQQGVLIAQLESIFLVHKYLDDSGVEFDRKGTIGVQCVKFDRFHIDQSEWNVKSNGVVVAQIPFNFVPDGFIPDSMKSEFNAAKRLFDRKKKKRAIPDCFNLAKERQARNEK